MAQLQMPINPETQYACKHPAPVPSSLSSYMIDVIPPPFPAPLPLPCPEPSEADVPANHDFVPPHRRRIIHSTKGNLWQLIGMGRGNDLFLNFTFQDDYAPNFDSLEAQRRMRSAIPHLDILFVAWLLVLELFPSPHYHGIAVCRDDNVAWGWDQDAYTRLWEIRDNARHAGRTLTADEMLECRILSKRVTSNPHLLKIWQEARLVLPGLGFRAGHPMHATPIQDARKCISYITKDLGETRTFAPAYRRGVSSVLKSTNIIWTTSTDFSWNTPRTRWQRLQKAKIASSLRVDGQDGCIRLLGGRNWHSRLMKLIGALNSRKLRWHELGDTDVEQEIITTLNAMVEVWAVDLSRRLDDRRYRHARGLPEFEPAVDVGMSIPILEDLRRCQEQQQRDASQRHQPGATASPLV